MESAEHHITPAPDEDMLGFLIADAARLLRTAFERRIAEAGLGLTAGEARVLINVADGDGARQLDIATRMGVEPMTVCTYLDKLQALGLIERQQCSADRRAKRVTLTPTSDEMITSIRRELRGILDQATQGMDAAETQRLRKMLALVNSNLQTLASDESR